MTAPLRPLPSRSRPTPRDLDARNRFVAACLQHQSTLYAVAMRLTRNPSDAGDLVQDTILRAMVAWRSFAPDTNLRAWLTRILTNSFISHYRKRRRHERAATVAPHDTRRACYGDDEDAVPHPMERAAATSLSDEVRGALARLSPEYREVVERADLRGEKYRTIADELAMPLGTVMSRLFRARRQLEGELAAYAAAEHNLRRAA